MWAAQGISTVVNVGKSGIYYAINKDHPEIKEELDNAMRRLEMIIHFIWQIYISSIFPWIIHRFFPVRRKNG